MKCALMLNVTNNVTNNAIVGDTKQNPKNKKTIFVFWYLLTIINKVRSYSIIFSINQILFLLEALFQFFFSFFLKQIMLLKLHALQIPKKKLLCYTSRKILKYQVSWIKTLTRYTVRDKIQLLHRIPSAQNQINKNFFFKLKNLNLWVAEFPL